MKTRYDKFSQKHRIKKLAEGDLQHYSELAEQVQYGGNPEHKKNPGDFGLTPPNSLRSAKSLCDAVRIFKRQIAREYLQSGLCRGLISEQSDGQWPRIIWSVSKEGTPLEARLENRETGTYHGYPIPLSDPWGIEIVRRWNTTDD